MSIVSLSRILRAAACGAALMGAACGGSSGSSATSPSPVAADATVSESFTTPLPVGGSIFYSFSIAAYGNLAVTLTDVAGVELPDGFTLTLVVGRPSGTSCSTESTISATPGETAQLTGVYGPGIFCVRVDDAGMLTAPATIAVTVAHA